MPAGLCLRLAPEGGSAPKARMRRPGGADSGSGAKKGPTHAAPARGGEETMRIPALEVVNPGHEESVTTQACSPAWFTFSERAS